MSPQITINKSFELLKKLVEAKLEITPRIKKELELLEEAPSFIPESFLKAYQAIHIEKISTARPVNECHSQIAFELGITSMSPGKISFHYPVAPSALPDIDNDFADNASVKDYAIQKYGEDRVCNIGTYGKYKFKSLLNDITRLFKDENGERLIPLEEVRQLAKKLGLKIDQEISTDDDIDNDEGIEFNNEDIEDFQRKYPYIFSHFKSLLGLPKYAGQHAAGVLILPEPFAQTFPIRRSKDEICTEWTEGQGVSELGSMGGIKIDLLGLNTLRVLEDANLLVVQRYNLDENSDSPCACKEEGKDCSTNFKLPFISRKNLQGQDVKLIDLDKLCLNIKPIFNIIAEGKTEGIFQFEPRGITEFAKSYGPAEFADLYYITSLYRPGAMDCHLDKDGMPIDKDTEPHEYAKAKGAHVRFVERRHGRDKITFPAPQLSEILGPSMGIAVFQEDISRIVMNMTGCSFASAEKIRKYFTKIKPELLRTDPKTIAYVEEMEKQFVEDSVKNGATREQALGAWNTILPFARYGFNKAHAVSYSLISYQTAFFRAFYPLEFFTSLLTHNILKEDKVKDYIRTIQKNNYSIRKPNINKSHIKFSIDAETNSIFSGLEMIKGVGEKAAASIVQNREQYGPFTSLDDFLSRDITWRIVSRRALEPLVKSGAFDDISPNRALTLAKILIAKGAAKKSDYETIDMFDEEDEPKKAGRKNIDIVVVDWEENEKLKFEREVFGFPFEDAIIKHINSVKKYFESFKNVVAKKNKVATCGVIEDLFVKPDKNGNNMAFMTATNLDGEKQRWVMFSSIYMQFSSKIFKGEPYFAFGKYEPEYESYLIEGLETVNNFISVFTKKETNILEKQNDNV